MTYFDWRTSSGHGEIPAVARPTVALIAAIPSAILADVLTLMFIGQIWLAGRPAAAAAGGGRGVRVRGRRGGRLDRPPVLPSLLPGDRVVGTVGQPARWRRRRGPGPAPVMIWTVIIVGGTLMFFLRYAAVAGPARRAIRKYLAGEV